MILVKCKGCDHFEVVAPGHPATEQDPVTGQHAITDRSALLADRDCPGGKNPSLHFMMMPGALAVTGTGG